jgi:hypothetical protein
MTKDKWINIRCTEQERQDITEQAKQYDMSVASYIRYLVAKERKEISEIERIRNIPSRECISREEIEKYRLVEERKEREKYGGGK